MTLRARIFRNAISQSTYNHRRAEQIERSHKPITISVEDALASCEENLNNLDAECRDQSRESYLRDSTNHVNDSDHKGGPEKACIHSNLPTSREAFSTETENLDKSQKSGLEQLPCCSGRLLGEPITHSSNLNNLDAETITGSNEREGSQMPAERNGDHKCCLPVERHACIQSISKGEE